MMIEIIGRALTAGAFVAGFLRTCRVSKGAVAVKRFQVIMLLFNKLITVDAGSVSFQWG
jgi:hypothetical protein